MAIDVPVTLKINVDASGIRNIREAIGSGFMEGAKKGAGLVGSGGKGAIGGLGNLFGQAGVFGLMLKGIRELTSVSKGIFRYSPAMAQSMKALETSFYLIMKPIGDTIGMILRPMALFLMRWIIENKGLAKLLGQVIVAIGGLKLLGMLGGGAAAGAGGAAATGGILGGIFGKGGSGILGKVGGLLKGIGFGIGGAAIGGALGGDLGGVLGAMLAIKFGPQLVSGIIAKIGLGATGGLGALPAALGMSAVGLAGAGGIGALGAMGIKEGAERSGLEGALGGGFYYTPSSGQVNYFTALQAALKGIMSPSEKYKVGSPAGESQEQILANIKAGGLEDYAKKYGWVEEFNKLFKTSEDVRASWEPLTVIGEVSNDTFDAMNKTVGKGVNIFEWGFKIVDEAMQKTVQAFKLTTGSIEQFATACAIGTGNLVTYGGAIASKSGGRDLYGGKSPQNWRKATGKTNPYTNRQGGGAIGEEGLYYLHAGEYVMPAYRGNTNTYNTAPIIINATMNNQSDIDRLARSIGERDFQRSRAY